ncbi:MAG TPA: porin PorA family protein, partial [Actinospica sp.]|nr:porin PorA family protein [Actinospica sp.]
AGWLNAGQHLTVNLNWLVHPGSVQSALITGVLGIPADPRLIEVIGWFAYLVPVGVFVAWPPHRKVARRTLPRITAAAAGAGVAAMVVLLVLSPAAPASNPATAAGTLSAKLSAAPGQSAVVRTVPQSPAADAGAAAAGTASVPITLHRTGSEQLDGVATAVYTASRPGTAAAARPTRLSLTQVAALNGGRLPLGVHTTDANATVGVQYRDTSTLTAWVEPRTGRIVDLRWSETVLATLTDTQVGAVPLDRPVTSATNALPAAVANAAADAARRDLATLHRRSALHAGAEAAVTVAVLALLATALLAVTGRRRRAEESVTHTTPAAVPATPEHG